MFTVIICDERMIADCRSKYAMYVNPLLDDKNLAFCAWHTDGVSLETAVPQLEDIIRNKKQWRAIVVNDHVTWSYDAVSARNPFDIVDSKKTPVHFSSVDEVLAYRAYCRQAFDTAVANPLAKLAIWLCGSPIRSKPSMAYAASLPELTDPAYFSRLEELGLSPVEVELDGERARRFEELSSRFVLDGELFNPPQMVVAVAERIRNVDSEAAAAAWSRHSEFDYSRFYEDNLYPERLRYLVQELPCIRGKQEETEYFRFLSGILLLAANHIPDNALAAGRVYRMEALVDNQRIGELCRHYNSKLCSTLLELDSLERRFDDRLKEPIERDEAKETFESDTTVPVTIDAAFDTEQMMAQHEAIGLSKNCPGNEYTYWDTQYQSIIKTFLRYLREPRRAVKTAVKYPFRSNSRIEDERALRMNEFQIEDVEFRLQEEEQNMIGTVTTQLFNTDEYTRKLEEADKEIRKGIAQRMTLKKTVYTGLIAMGAYFFGFLPFLFSGVNTFKSFPLSLLITGITLALFAVAGLVTLFVFRHRLINRFKHFNYVMSGIQGEIHRGLESFSKYLSHACNVMREMSVLRYIRTKRRERHNVLEFHRCDIQQRILEVNRLFSKYLDAAEYTFERCEPYDYDFTKSEHYVYDMPYSHLPTRIPFLQEGNEIVVPVDYVSAVILTREELYD